MVMRVSAHQLRSSTTTRPTLNGEERAMRLRKFGPAVLAAASLLALAPAAASAERVPAHRHAHLRGQCAIDIESLAPNPIAAGDQAEIKGTLCPGGTGGGAQPVELYEHVAGTAGYVPVQSVTTEASGAYELTTPPQSKNASFYVSADGVRSKRVRLWVEVQATLSGPPEGTQIETGPHHKEIFSGKVNPVDEGARVILQRQNAVGGEEWHRIGIGYVQSGGLFTIKHTFRVPGDASIRVLVRSSGINAPTSSNELEYDISQQQNPALTIASSADPISYGQPATISGTFAGATSSHPVTLTLLARTVHQRGFAPVAQTDTGAGGAYAFAPQTPVNNTIYRVQGAGRESAVLYEGVREVLTATAPPSTVQSGQALEFNGTVAPNPAPAPGQTGHPIYLERQDAEGTGFHVIQVGHLLPNSTYSIVHQFYVPGTKVVRIVIPGGPGNGRAVSQPFTIQVTPAPASALAPEAPGNTSLPSEGQTTGPEAER
jgi:hypothetical protein